MSQEELLKEREKTHGAFKAVAKLQVELINAFNENTLGVDFSNEQTVALNLIFLKIARIGIGNAKEIDHWRDIAGYAELVVKELENANLEAF